MVYSFCAAEQKPVMAPDFSLVDFTDRLINLTDFKGKNVVLIFYVSHSWQPWLQQLVEFQRGISELKEYNAEVIAISSRGDRRDVEKTKKALNLTFALIPGPNRKVAEEFAVYDQEKKRAIATLILDKEGMIRFKYISKDPEDRPSFSKIIKWLQEIK